MVKFTFNNEKYIIDCWSKFSGNINAAIVYKMVERPFEVMAKRIFIGTLQIFPQNNAFKIKFIGLFRLEKPYRETFGDVSFAKISDAVSHINNYFLKIDKLKILI